MSKLTRTAGHRLFVLPSHNSNFAWKGPTGFPEA